MQCKTCIKAPLQHSPLPVLLPWSLESVWYAFTSRKTVPHLRGRTPGSSSAVSFLGNPEIQSVTKAPYLPRNLLVSPTALATQTQHSNKGDPQICKGSTILENHSHLLWRRYTWSTPSPTKDDGSACILCTRFKSIITSSNLITNEA